MFERDEHELPEVEELTGGERANESAEPDSEGLRVTRRTALVAGSAGVGGIMATGFGAGIGASVGGLALGAGVAEAALPTTTAPEQLRLEWGSDPATEVTVSWSAPGTVAMPAPMLAYSTSPITVSNPGALVFLPDPEPLDLAAGPRTEPCATSFDDGQTAQTTYHYHVPLTGLAPDTIYYYEVSDGAGSTASGQFQTAPTGRASFRFTAFGDQGVNQPSPYTTAGIADPLDGAGAPLFHLMVGDLAYADGSNPPLVWREWATMNQVVTANFPWMPVMGNHEVELGATNVAGVRQTTGTSGSYYNGPYGSGSFFSRFVLPDNGITNWDGNSLQGSFYSFQIGTVLFIALAGNDVNWQTSDYSQAKPALYTGELEADVPNMAMVPAGSTPNLQTQWLEQTLQAARAEGSGVEMIVVQMHFPFASVDTGNSCDMGVRTTWGPLFDKYQVDITLTGHNHNYCRSLPTRGFDAPSGVTQGALTNPFGTYASGATIDTRRPTVTQSAPVVINDEPTFDTSLGTVHLVVGGGGAASTIGETIDPITELPQAYPFAGQTSNVQAVEDAPWLGYYDTANAYGYAVFDVDPGDGPGQTSITFQWYSMPSAGPATAATLLEKFVFARMTGEITPGTPEITGTVSPGLTVTANAGSWSPSEVALSYQWLLSGELISGATAQTYTIVDADVGQELQVEVTGTLQGYSVTSATSVAIVVSGGQMAPSAVTVSGQVQVGGTVVADPGTWTPAPQFSYQWLLDGEPISGATTATYQPAVAEAGHVLQVQVTGTLSGYQPVTVVSVAQTVLSGTASSSEVLTAATLSVTPAVGVSVRADLAGRTASGISYQWLLNGTAIKGARSASYTPVPADAGKRLQVRITSPGQVLISKAQTVKDAHFSAASRPGFRGTSAVGRSLTAISGKWSPSPKLAYQWLLDGEPVKGATGRTFVVPAASAGKAISLRVVARRTGYVTRSETSDAVVIGKGALRSSIPRIEGQARVGGTLHVATGDWENGTEFSYRWSVGGRNVAGRTVAGRAVSAQARGIAYQVRPQDRGKRITVEVTGRVAGREPVVRKSASTLPVRGA